MTKKDEEVFKEIFKEGQLALIKRAIVKTQELTPNLKAATLRIGSEINLLLYGTDLNENTHYMMLSEDTFNSLKKLKLKGN